MVPSPWQATWQDAPSASAQKSNRPAIIIGILIAVVVLGAVIGEVVFGGKKTDNWPKRTASAPSSTIVPGPPLVTAAPPVAPAAACEAPPDGVVELINGSFTGGEHLEDVQAVNGPDKLIYVGGNIFGADGTKVSSADVWLLENKAIYIVSSLSSDARNRTTWPDGREKASAGDEYGSAVIACVSSR